MVTNNTYYKNEIYIPHAKPSVSADVTTVSAELDAFIEEYERECLIKSLGLQLATEFMNKLDPTKANGLVTGADTKWDDLLNGKSYTNPAGEAVEWRGVRYKEKPTDDVPSKSFLANYVFYHYEKNADVFRTGIGYVKGKATNTVERSPAPRVVNAWRKMVDIIQGKEFAPQLIVRHFGWGIDYYYDNSEVTLYQFIRDMNEATPDTYANFKPGKWDAFKNEFGI